jgi:hypothetical protein
MIAIGNPIEWIRKGLNFLAVVGRMFDRTLGANLPNVIEQFQIQNRPIHIQDDSFNRIVVRMAFASPVFGHKATILGPVGNDTPDIRSLVAQETTDAL